MFARLWLAFSMLTGCWLQFSLPDSLSQPAINFEQVSVEYTFDREIFFSVSVEEPSTLIKQMEIVIHTPQQTLVENIPTADKTYTYRLDLAEMNLAAFSRLTYAYQIKTNDGEMLKSPDYTFLYGDNRFNWKTLEQTGYRLHWYSDSENVPQELVNISEKGLAAALQHFPTEAGPFFDLYLYDKGQPLHQALKLPATAQVIAHSLPEENIILLSADPASADFLIQLERQIPHEISHLIQHQTMGNAYDNLPLWLSEGVAGLSELYPNAQDEQRVLTAARNNTLLPIKDLCHAFPPDEAQNNLAYAQSAQFVGYLEGSYGQAGMQKLITTYGDGLDCEHGFSTALGTSLEQAEEDWKRERLNIPSNAFFMGHILPYLLTALLLVASTLFSLWFWRK